MILMLIAMKVIIAEDLAKHDQHYAGYSLPCECPYGAQSRNSIKQGIPNQRKIFKARSTKPNKFHEGDLVLKAVQRGLHSTRNYNWEGPFMVAKSVAGGYYKLVNTVLATTTMTIRISRKRFQPPTLMVVTLLLITLKAIPCSVDTLKKSEEIHHLPLLILSKCKRLSQRIRLTWLLHRRSCVIISKLLLTRCQRKLKRRERRRRNPRTTALK